MSNHIVHWWSIFSVDCALQSINTHWAPIFVTPKNVSQDTITLWLGKVASRISLIAGDLISKRKNILLEACHQAFIQKFASHGQICVAYCGSI